MMYQSIVGELDLSPMQSKTLKALMLEQGEKFSARLSKKQSSKPGKGKRPPGKAGAQRPGGGPDFSGPAAAQGGEGSASRPFPRPGVKAYQESNDIGR
jgi:hypothetical protein